MRGTLVQEAMTTSRRTMNSTFWTITFLMTIGSELNKFPHFNLRGITYNVNWTKMVCITNIFRPDTVTIGSAARYGALG